MKRSISPSAHNVEIRLSAKESGLSLYLILVCLVNRTFRQFRYKFITFINGSIKRTEHRFVVRTLRILGKIQAFHPTLLSITQRSRRNTPMHQSGCWREPLIHRSSMEAAVRICRIASCHKCLQAHFAAENIFF